MKDQKTREMKGSEKFVIVIFIMIIIAAVGINIINRFRGENNNISENNLNARTEDTQVNEVASTSDELISIKKQNLSVNTSSVVLTPQAPMELQGSVDIISSPKERVYRIKVKAPHTVQNYAYLAWLNDTRSQEYKKLGELTLDAFGNYFLEKKIISENNEFTHIYIILSQKNSEVFEGKVILKGVLFGE